MYYGKPLRPLPRQRVLLSRFGGYDHRPAPAPGDWAFTENLSGDEYPLLSVRKPRGLVATLSSPRAIQHRGRLIWLDGERLYYKGADLTGYLTAKGLRIGSDSRPRQILSLGAYVLLFPDKLYLNLERCEDCGSLEQHYTSTGPVRYSLAKSDGTDLAEPVVSPTAPQSPADGALWVDSSGVLHSLKQFSAAEQSWTELPSPCTRISAPGIGEGFRALDGVTIEGCRAPDSTEIHENLQSLTGLKCLVAASQDSLIVPGLLDAAYTQTQGAVTVSRTVPDMDYLTQCGNRLWGCKYGLVEGKPVNEIYCCALGDPKNWHSYAGLSTDSYAASLGSDGPFTGAVSFQDSPLFFKETCLHRVYVSPVGAHRIVESSCPGVELGSAGSLTVVGGRLLYKSREGLQSYDGAVSRPVSPQLGRCVYRDAVAGARGSKYYVSMKDSAGLSQLFTLDTDTGLLFREDSPQVLGFCEAQGELYFLDGATGQLLCVDGKQGTPEPEPPWQCVSGPLEDGGPDKAYVSRFQLRLYMPAGSHVEVLLAYDDEPVWHSAGRMDSPCDRTVLFPVRPRRCDHFRLQLRGRGSIRLHSLCLHRERGSEA